MWDGVIVDQARKPRNTVLQKFAFKVVDSPLLSCMNIMEVATLTQPWKRTYESLCK